LFAAILDIKALSFARHCERSEAIQDSLAKLDCFVAPLLAMTARPRAYG
jgi:hypothetical protein